MRRRRLCIADLHGEYHRLLSVLEQANYGPDDSLYCLGDYIDRGEDSKITIELVMELQRNGAVVLRGNHEQVASCLLLGGRLATAHWPHSPQEQMWIWYEQGGNTTMRDYNGAIPTDVLQWMGALPLYHEEEDLILIHAGLRPGIKLENQATDDLLWIRNEFILYPTAKLIVFGHTPTPLIHFSDMPYFGDGKIGLDTGAVFGGKLTLMDLDSKEIWQA